jgi:hypothetical protein
MSVSANIAFTYIKPTPGSKNLFYSVCSVFSQAKEIFRQVGFAVPGLKTVF